MRIIMEQCRRGRPKLPRTIGSAPEATYFKPRGVPLVDLEMVTLSYEELEALRLVDLLGMEQEAAARKMGITRKPLWTELRRARAKVTDALVNGKAIEINGGNFTVSFQREFSCGDCGHRWAEPFGTGRPRKCPECRGVRVWRSNAQREQSGMESDVVGKR